MSDTFFPLKKLEKKWRRRRVDCGLLPLTQRFEGKNGYFKSTLRRCDELIELGRGLIVWTERPAGNVPLVEIARLALAEEARREAREKGQGGGNETAP